MGEAHPNFVTSIAFRDLLFLPLTTTAKTVISRLWFGTIVWDTEVLLPMARPRHEQPTPAELEILKILWTRNGPTSVRDVLGSCESRDRPAACLHVGHELAQRHDR